MGDCPSTSDLERFWQGQLDPEERRRIAAHVEDCERCGRTIDAALASPTVSRTPTRAADDSWVLRPGETLGDYVLRERIGAGSFGDVFRAERQRPFRQRVAIKVLKAGMDSRAVLARFEAERQALALMQHPSVARVFDAGVAPNGRSYIVMEYVPGLSITRHCDRHRLGLDERLQLFRQVCSAVQHAHQKGIIHRDLKPGNILVAFEGGKATPKIIDFGVAKALERRLSRETVYTERGQVVGTPAYMSPEQAKASGRDIDTRSDVYSLGVLLYELLTGSLPFDRSTLEEVGLEEIRRLIQEVDPPRPSTKLRTLATSPTAESTAAAENRRVSVSSLARRLRGDLDWITMKCLEKDRSRRYDSAAELARDVQRHLEQEPVIAGPPGAGYRMRKFVRRHRGALAATATIFVILLAAVVTVTALAVSRVQISRRLELREARELVEEARFLSYQWPDEAWAKLETAARKDPDSLEVLLEKARLLRMRGSKAEAIEAAQQALALDSSSGRAAALLAGLLRESAPEEAERYRRQAEGSLEKHELYHALALGLDDHEEAIGLLTRSLDLQPWSFDALWERGERHFRKGDHESALEDADLMVRVRGDLGLAWILKGAILLELGKKAASSGDRNAREAASARYEEALSVLEHAVDRDPDQWIGPFNRALALGLLWRNEEALEELDRAEGLSPPRSGAAVISREKARNLRDLGRLEESIAAFDRALELGDEDWRTLFGRAEVLTLLREYPRALEDLDAAVERAGDDPDRYAVAELYVWRAMVHINQGKHDLARAGLEKAAKVFPDLPQLRYEEGRIHSREGRYDEARAAFRRAAELAPGVPDWLLYRGVGAWMAGEPEAALPDLVLFAAADDAELAWINLWIWEIETARGNVRGASAALAAAERDDSPLLSAMVEAYRGESSPDEVLAAATSEKERFLAIYHLGALAFAGGRGDEAVDWFGRCTEMGFDDQVEHELALWHLRGLGLDPP